MVNRRVVNTRRSTAIRQFNLYIFEYPSAPGAPTAPAIGLFAETIEEASQMAEDIWRERRADDPAVAFCLVDSASARIVHFGGQSKNPQR
jgi:hypothetical protein